MSHLTYTQALLLLGLPAEEREEFIAHNDVGGMTTKDLQQALKDREEANQAKEQALQERGQALQANQVLKKGLETIGSTISELKMEKATTLSTPTNPENVQAKVLGSRSELTPDFRTSNDTPKGDE